MKSLSPQITRYFTLQVQQFITERVSCIVQSVHVLETRTIGQYHSEGVPQTYQVHQRTAGRVGLSQELGGGLSKTLNLVLYGLSVNKIL